jgi:hypothetical protein
MCGAIVEAEALLRQGHCGRTGSSPQAGIGRMNKWAIMAATLACCTVNAVCRASQLAPNQAEFGNENVRVIVDIKSNIYTYKVTNSGKSPILGFEVTQHVAYNFRAPASWETDVCEGLFMARAASEGEGIRPGNTGEFSMRVSSKGAVLGRGKMKLRLESGETIVLPEIWSPVAEPGSHVLLVAGVILLIALAHAAVVIVKSRRPGRSSVRA